MCNKKYIITLDQGTTSSRAVIFDREQNIVGMTQKEFRQIYPQPRYVEHDPMEIYSSQYSVFAEAMTQFDIKPGEIDSIGITNQRETTVVWDKKSGRPVYNAIVWQCRRTAPLCEKIKEDGFDKYIREATGLIPDAYFSATKLKWILDNVGGAREKADRGELLFGTVDTWLIWKLTGGRVHATDRTNASRTMLYNIREHKWDKKLLEYFGIPESMLPEVRNSSSFFGTVSVGDCDIPIRGVAGDQQAALFGQRCFDKGQGKNTYGTGCFLLVNTGAEFRLSEHGMLTTVAVNGQGQPCYAMEGSVFVAGALVQWLRDSMGLISESSDSEYFAKKVPDNGGVYVVPAFTGLGAPYWDMYARGAILGLTRGTGRNHIIRASLEAIAYQTADICSALEADMGAPFSFLRADGGASSNNFLMQFQADILNKNVIRPYNRESTALGGAMLSGLASGFWSGRDEFEKINLGETSFTPAMDGETRERLLSGWKKAVERAGGWAER